jgi:hypothetical protein
MSNINNNVITRNGKILYEFDTWEVLGVEGLDVIGLKEKYLEIKREMFLIKTGVSVSDYYNLQNTLKASQAELQHSIATTDQSGEYNLPIEKQLDLQILSANAGRVDENGFNNGSSVKQLVMFLQENAPSLLNNLLEKQKELSEPTQKLKSIENSLKNYKLNPELLEKVEELEKQLFSKDEKNNYIGLAVDIVKAFIKCKGLTLQNLTQVEYLSACSSIVFNNEIDTSFLPLTLWQAV